jgi:Ca2+-binding RTX toxin-like protein
MTMTDHARGGNDVVTGYANDSVSGIAALYGDAKSLTGFAIGGNDKVIATSGSTQMYGDGAELLDHSKGGDDTLISGTGNDQMWGDAAVVAPTAQTGADTFVFSPPNGHDTINDFQPGKDHIELDGFGFGSFNDVANDIQYNANGALITFDPNDSIVVVGVNHLNASDFILA